MTERKPVVLVPACNRLYGHHVYHNVYTSGRITSQTNALGYTTTFAWNATTQVATTTDARSKQWTSYYAGNVLQKRVDPLGNTTTYTYNSQLLPTKIVGVPPTGMPAFTARCNAASSDVPCQ